MHSRSQSNSAHQPLLSPAHQSQPEAPATPPSDRLADLLAPAMFWLSALQLALTATVIVLWIDVPRIVETYDLAEKPTSSPNTSSDFSQIPLALDAYSIQAIAWGDFCFQLMLGLWPLFVLEPVLQWLLTPRTQSFARNHPYWWAFCLAPPLRLCARHRAGRHLIWMPRLGWQVVDESLHRRLERIFSVPMIGIALLILPILALQTYFQDRIVEHPALRTALHVATGVIWFAFALEFIVMVSVTSRKFDYCRRHWLDLVIILLPLISFLRSLRILRASKLLSVPKIQQLSKLVRVYRLRGVALRGWRALLLFDLVERLLYSSPEQQIRRLEAKCQQRERELAQLREQLALRREQLKPPADSRSGPPPF